MSQLPKYAALKSKYAQNQKYLCYINQTCSPIHKFLRFSSNDILTPFTKFEFEQAACDPSLYHIKCCYSNKYWCSLASDHNYIVADADEKEEDKSKWNCTLFRPSFDTCKQSYRFLHVKLGFNVVLWRVGPPYGEVLRAQWSEHDKDLCDLCIVINWDSLTLLPKYVAFKGDNGSYLRAIMINKRKHLQFSSNHIEDETIRMETFTTNDGKVRIKSINFESLWNRDASNNWILADLCPSTPPSPDNLFSPTRLAPNVVALCNLGNEHFVRRFTTGGNISLLSAILKELDVHSRFEIIELVSLRNIHNVVFYPLLAKISVGANITIQSKEVVNNTPCPKTNKVSFLYKCEVSSTWDSWISTKLVDVKTRLESEIAVVYDEKKTGMLPTKFIGEYKWGSTITTPITIEKTFEVTIPGMHSISVSFIATSAKLQVPFSYKQTDVLIGGKKVEYSFEDGVYNGANLYDFRIQTTTKSLCGCP